MTDENSFSKKYSGFLLGGILLLGAALRLPGLTRSLWFDEVWYSTQVGSGGMWQRLWENMPAPSYPLLMSFWDRLFGDSVFSVRMVPFFCGVFAIGAIYLVAQKLTDQRSALIAAFLLCLSPVHIWYSREAAPYSMLLLLVLMSVFSFSKIKEKTCPWGWGTVYFLCLLDAVFTHWFVLVFVAMFSCLIGPEKNKRVKFLVWGLNLVIVICASCFLILKSQMTHTPILAGESFLRAFTPWEGWLLFFNWFSMGNSLWPLKLYSHSQAKDLLERPYLLLSQCFFAYLFLMGLIAQVKETRRIDLCLYLFALPLTLVLLSLQWPHLYIERYLLILLPFFYIALGKGATHFKRRWHRFFALALLVVYEATAVIGCLNYSQKEMRSVYKPNGDWRAAVEYFAKDQSEEGGLIVILSTTPTASLIYHQGQFRKSNKTYPDFHIFRYLGGNRDFFYKNPGIKFIYLINDVYWKSNFEVLRQRVDKDPHFEYLSTTPLSGLRIFKYRVKSPDEKR